MPPAALAPRNRRGSHQGAKSLGRSPLPPGRLRPGSTGEAPAAPPKPSSTAPPPRGCRRFKRLRAIPLVARNVALLSAPTTVFCSALGIYVFPYTPQSGGIGPVKADAAFALATFFLSTAAFFVELLLASMGTRRRRVVIFPATAS